MASRRVKHGGVVGQALGQYAVPGLGDDDIGGADKILIAQPRRIDVRIVEKHDAAGQAPRQAERVSSRDDAVALRVRERLEIESRNPESAERGEHHAFAIRHTNHGAYF